MTNSAPREDTKAYANAARWSVIALSVIAVAGAALGWFTGGRDGVFTALVGIAVAGVFSLTTSLAAWVGSRKDPGAFVTIVSATWLLKIVLVIAAMVAAGYQTWLVRPLFGAIVLAGALAALAIDVIAVQKARIPYIDMDTK